MWRSWDCCLCTEATITFPMKLVAFGLTYLEMAFPHDITQPWSYILFLIPSLSFHMWWHPRDCRMIYYKIWTFLDHEMTPNLLVIVIYNNVVQDRNSTKYSEKFSTFQMLLCLGYTHNYVIIFKPESWEILKHYTTLFEKNLIVWVHMIDDHNIVILCIITLLSDGDPHDITRGLLGV